MGYGVNEWAAFYFPIGSNLKMLSLDHCAYVEPSGQGHLLLCPARELEKIMCS